MLTTRLFVLGLLVVGLFGLGTLDAQAQKSKRQGTAGAEELLIPVTARTTAVGTAMTAGAPGMSGVEALFANPANLSLNSGTNALFSRMEYAADIGVNHFGVAQRFGNNNIAFTLTSWDFGDIPLQTETDPEITSVTWSANYITLGASYARQFTDRIAAGVTFKGINERIDDVSATGIAFDAGMNYTVGESGLRFGVSLKNFGPSMDFDGTGLIKLVRLPDQDPNTTPNAVQIEGAKFELPSLLNFGVSYTRELGASTTVALMGNFRSNSFSQDQYTGALELGFRDLLYLRGGYQFEEDMDLSFYEGWNVGAGLNLPLGGNRLSIDYAYRGTQYFEGVQMFTASLTL